MRNVVEYLRGENIMDKEDLKEKFKTGVDKVVSSSRKAIDKASAAMQDFSDKSVIKIEKHQFEAKLDGEYKILGKLVEERFSNDENAIVSVNDEDVIPIMERIKQFKDEIEIRNKKLEENSH